MPFLPSIRVSLMTLTQEMVFNFVLREPFKIKTSNSMAMAKLGHENKKLIGPLLSRNLSSHSFLLHQASGINDI